ncbi:MAG: hypothetical protein HQK65_17350 [Desulfamplus sp.]|nr:hypothetical protein [Desulfamplus sp.]
MKELKEPRPGGKDCIPWLGETEVKEKMIRLCVQGKIAINLRGMEYLQRDDSETEEQAWKRMRGKLGTGKHLDETHILLPQNVPATGGASSNPEPAGVDQSWGGGTNGGTGSTGGAIGESGGTGNSGTSSGSGLGDSSDSDPGGIFGGGSSYTTHSEAATSALNLLGKIENWGITTGTQVRSMELKISHLTGAQLQELIRKLPDGMVYELELEKENKA